MPVSERRVCRVLGQHRSTQRKTPRGADDEAALTEDIIAFARQYGRYGYRRVTALLREAGWHVSFKRVERIWRREGLKVPQKQPKRGRLWLNDGSCIRLRPEYHCHRAGPDPRREPSTSARSPFAGSGREAYYPNCAAARAAGAAPIRVEEPGYRAGLDRDGDGVACE